MPGGRVTEFPPLATASLLKMHIVCFGTYDLDKPRNRLIVTALRARGHQVTEIHGSIWQGVADKSQLRGLRILGIASRWIGARHQRRDRRRWLQLPPPARVAESFVAQNPDRARPSCPVQCEIGFFTDDGIICAK